MNVRDIKIFAGIRQFTDWWAGELRILVPRSMENWIGGGPAQVILRMGEKQTRLLLRENGEEQDLGECDLLDGGSDNFEQLRELIAQQIPKDATVQIELAEHRALTREAFLPIATEHTLNQVIGFEMDRLTPFTASQVGYTCRILERMPEQNKIRVELNIVRRDYLNDLLAGVLQLGLAVNAVYLGQQNSRVYESRDNLLPADMQPEVEPLWSNRNRSLLAVLLLLIGLTLVFPIYRQVSSIEQLETEIASVSKNAGVVGHKKRLLIAHLEGREILVNKKNNRSAKLENIRKLTELLPDNTWVSKLTIDDENISMQGESLKSSDLIEMLEQEKLFKNVEFVSPVTINRSSNMERYEIRLQLAENDGGEN